MNKLVEQMARFKACLWMGCALAAAVSAQAGALDQPARDCGALTIVEYCAKIGGASFIAKMPDLMYSPIDDARLKELKDLRIDPRMTKTEDLFRVRVTCLDSDRIGLTIYNNEFGSMAMSYATETIGQKGFVFSMFPLSGVERQKVSGSSPGSFAVINSCELEKGHLVGILVYGQHIEPIHMFGALESTTDRTGLPQVTSNPSDGNEGGDKTPKGPIDPFDFSGYYEFEMPEAFCVSLEDNFLEDFHNAHGGKRGRNSPDRHRGGLSKCPLVKAHLTVNAVAGDTPIVDLSESGSVFHLIDGPRWNGAREFRISVANGDSTRVMMPLWQIIGTISDPAHPSNCLNGDPRPNLAAGSSASMGICFKVLGPKGGDGQGYFGPFYAVKVRDYLNDIDVRPLPQ